MAGGDSSEREIALGSAKTISDALDRDKYNIYIVDVEGRSWSYIDADGTKRQVDKNDFSLVYDGERIVLEYALIIIHGTPGEDGKLQGYLDIMRIPYSSCSMVSSVVTFDKITTKRAVADWGVNLARHIFVCKGETVDPQGVVADLGLPLFVKPNASGSSYGVTKVSSADDLQKAIDAALKESDDVLIEEFIAGREFGCGLMIAGGKEYIFPLTEIVSKTEFFDTEAKYTKGMSDEITPARVGEGIAEQIRAMALMAYKACRCSGVVRIDFIVTPEDVPYMIEVNSIPGMSAASIVPQQVAAAGMTLGHVFDMIIADR